MAAFLACGCADDASSTHPGRAASGGSGGTVGSGGQSTAGSSGAATAGTSGAGGEGGSVVAPVNLAVTRLRSEYRVNPLGIDVAKPRFDWLLESDVRGQRQTAYQVLVASSVEALAADQGDLWDSGKVVSDQSTQLEFGGEPLGSRERVLGDGVARAHGLAGAVDRGAGDGSRPRRCELDLVPRRRSADIGAGG
ncbi:MAG TPA: hypothetical protein VM686_20295 [Polyangiaceae bacterium]|nr:hypothetical protein [Polyangiaceae bacterium]